MLLKPFLTKLTLKPTTIFQFNQQRELHIRNKKVLNNRRLIPLLRTAKENFKLALEADNTNTHARYWLSKLHLKYHVPGANKAVGAALLVEAAGHSFFPVYGHNEYVQSDQQAFYYLEKVVDQLHPGALYLLGAVYLAKDCFKKDIASALWCFHRASEKGHAGSAIAYGSLLLKGVQVLESLTKFSVKRVLAAKKARKNTENHIINPVEIAREQFQIAAKAGSDLGLKWLQRLEEEEKRMQITE
ncbi:Protein sel-1 1 like [Quillaja saponaria]|uniref:Protein sel-1 1 like n=1 Tax=Quillaja saponaria TaxID=32244 RepID=A0AAD7QCL2_QUISA|nr:Protein sel-1 1 like [Quillaja saponaria]